MYWPEQIADKKLEGKRLTRQESWHALPPDWTQTEYTEFLVRRRRLIAKVIREGFQQLSDPNYVPDLSTEEQVGAEPIDLPSFEELVVSGVIPAGTALTAADPDISVDAEVLDDGYIKVGDHTYEDLDRAATPPAPTSAQAGPFGRFISPMEAACSLWLTFVIRSSGVGQQPEQPHLRNADGMPRHLARHRCIRCNGRKPGSIKEGCNPSVAPLLSR